MIILSEIFSSFQGEGRNLGLPSTFIRLGGCNLGCVWCDSAYTWRFSEKQPHLSPEVYRAKDMFRLEPEGIIEEIRGRPALHLVFTGGEPMLQQGSLVVMFDQLLAWGYLIEVETAGTIVPLDTFSPAVQWTVSPKMSNSGNPHALRYNAKALTDYAQLDSVFKFVVSEPSDFKEIDDFVKIFPEVKPERIYIMPEGTTPERIIMRSKNIGPMALKRGYSFTTRLHILVYGNQRGT